jgi:hypothetical protein
VHAMPDFLNDVTPTEAVDYVLPLISSLAMDEGEHCSVLSWLAISVT